MGSGRKKTDADLLVSYQGSHRPRKVLEFDLGLGKLKCPLSWNCPGIL